MKTGAANGFLSKARRALRWDEFPAVVRRAIVGVVGGTILVIGVAMIVLPGPAFIVIPVGLAVLATEFAWARHYLNRAHDLVRKARDKARSKKSGATSNRESVIARG